MKIPNGEKLDIPVDDGNSCGLYMISGEIIVENEKLRPTSITKFSPAGDTFSVTASEQSHLIIFGGKPLEEPIVSYASFVMNSEDQIKDVLKSYHAGEMGSL